MNAPAPPTPPTVAPRHAGVRAPRGFTLIELLVAVVVLGVVLSLAAPSFSNLMSSNRLSTQTTEFITSINLARSEAVRRGQPVSMRSDDADNYSKGWKVFTDDNADGAIPGTPTATDGTVVRENGAFSGQATVKRVTRGGVAPSFTYTTSAASDRMFLVFDRRGSNNAGAAAFFKVCDASNTSVKGRIVQVNVVGKVTLDSVGETCP